ncbi:MAG: SET domain-containing protein-lysine N-methyltransferase [Chromatiales bacterium]|nr:SET domain-containing protein-lysine N-methyltransferase [Chromatiales bacterium]
MQMQLDTTLEPEPSFLPEEQFIVTEREEGKGKAVYSSTGHARGELIARFTGEVLPYRTQHTLQINPAIHLSDLKFVGYLAHSCQPNVFVDMQSLEVWALEDIYPHQALTMDYAATEDLLYKQFACLCGSPGCRHWITGRKEKVNAQGRKYLRKFKAC